MIMCWPSLKPQMIGEPTFPGEVMENVSVAQSPIVPSLLRVPALFAAVVPVTGPAMVLLEKSNLMRHILLLHGQIL